MMSRHIGEICILIVDDDRNARRLMTTVLNEIGVGTVNAEENGEGALAFLGRHKRVVDLVICDWLMPGMNGLELLMRVHNDFPGMPFIMVTGKRDVQSVVTARENGVSGYIVKPYSPRQLQEKIESILHLVPA